MRPPLNRIRVVVLFGARDDYVFDDRAREPFSPPDRPGVSVTLRVQWDEADRAAQSPKHSGDEPTSAGYFLIRPADLLRAETVAGRSLAKGDIVVSKSGVALNPRLYVTELKQTAHQSVADGATLWRVNLSDRSPAR